MILCYELNHLNSIFLHTPPLLVDVISEQPLKSVPHRMDQVQLCTGRMAFMQEMAIRIIDFPLFFKTQIKMQGQISFKR